MGFLNFKKKKGVPEELPDLISDDLEKDSGEVHEFLKEQEIKKEINTSDEVKEQEKSKINLNSNEKSAETKSLEIEEKKESEEQRQNRSRQIVSRLVKNIEETPILAEKNEGFSEKSFFEDLQESLGGEIKDLDNLEDWYENKFLPKDVLSEMRQYWENQKTNSILKILGKNFQEKINEKLSALQSLEKEWQSAYFEMVEKEEAIKDQERDLKKLLREFVEICKTKKKTLETSNKDKKGGQKNGQKK